MTTTNKFRTLYTTVRTKLPEGHTKAERIEELNTILTTDPNMDNELITFIDILISQLNRLDDEQYMSTYSVKDKSDGLPKKSVATKMVSALGNEEMRLGYHYHSPSGQAIIDELIQNKPNKGE